MPTIFVRILSNLNYSYIFSKCPKISNLMKMRPAGVAFFHADRQTVGLTITCDKVNSPLRNFAHAPRKRQNFQNIICN